MRKRLDAFVMQLKDCFFRQLSKSKTTCFTIVQMSFVIGKDSF